MKEFEPEHASDVCQNFVDDLIHVDILPKINFAIQQSDVPLIRVIELTNPSSERLENLAVIIESEPEFFPKWQKQIPFLERNSSLSISEPDLILSPEFMINLSERLKGKVNISLTNGSIVSQVTHELELLAHNEWPGFTIVPELLAAYILPNSAVVEKILINSVEVLKSWGDNSGLNGYQEKNSKKVLRVAAAIYNSVSLLSLNYSVPPASFEDYGQKIRFPEKIADTVMGTCLDLSLLLAACFEGAGINPIIVFTRGHAFVGFWLKDESFPLSWLDEVLPIKKRVELNEICVFETTVLTGNKADFDMARSIAEKKLVENDFVGLIDVKRSRSHNIRPLPVVFEGNKVLFKADTAKKTEEISNDIFQPPVESIVFTADQVEENKDENRIDQWKRKLLDLTLRNRLLNFKETKKSLQILTPSLGKLEDMLADGTEIQIKSIPENILGGRSRNVYLENTGKDIIDEFLNKEFQQRRLYSNQTDSELIKRLTDIYREARNSLQEGGANTLFLGAGFLNWYESETSDLKRSAPIILIPLEIRRNSVQEGFRISQRDEESQINVTLLELLKADHGLEIKGLDPLPLDDHGIDLDKILNTFRRAILNISRWEVTEEAFVGLFHFQKFLMWKDLESRTDKLLENSIVNHLVNGAKESYFSQGEFSRAQELDHKYSLNKTFCPLSADSSQLVAVHSAAEGKSFVLHGPPGTGKSQTITNIIAHSIASGKTVLFVSEKAAALNVVFKRLSNLGLAPFCLELHSNKSSKAEVLKQLNDGLNATFDCDDKEWLGQAKQLEELRHDLNRMADLIHQTQPLGISLYQGIGKISGLDDLPFCELNWSTYLDCTKEKLGKLTDILQRVIIIGEEFEEMDNNPWLGTKIIDWEPSLNSEIEKLSFLLAEQATESSAQIQALEKGFSGFNRPASLSEVDYVSRYFANLIKLKAASAKLLTDTEWETKKEKIGKILKIGLEFADLKNSIQETFSKDFLRQDFNDLQQKWNQANAAWWPKSWFLKRSLFNELFKFLNSGKSVTNEQVSAIIAKGVSLEEKLVAIHNASEFAEEYLDSLWEKESSDWSLIQSELELIEQQRECLKGLCHKDVNVFKKLNEAVCKHLESVKAMKAVDSETLKLCSNFEDNVSRMMKTVGQLFEKLGYVSSDCHDDYLDFLQDLGSSWQRNTNTLRNWCLLNKTILEASENGLSKIVEALEAKKFKLKDSIKVFEKSFYKSWTAELVNQHSELRDFSGDIHNSKIQKFQVIDEDFLNSTRKVLSSRLSARVPQNGQNAVGNSEMGILNREIRKKRQHKPLRVLFQETSNLIPRLKPCFLMSPLSVAQYLSTEQPLFDLVIFDEASQMPVWDAVGAIARGKELIVVGDPKQLPPTNFFSKTEGTEWEEAELVEDLDSILEDCLAAGLPSLYLNWHYRSLHETLIAFSNYNYYENRLHTFPSAYFEGLGLSLIHVADGIYDKGKSRTNKVEAEKIVAKVIQRLKDSDLKHYSIGIVTFNASQQTLIEDLLDEERRKNPEIEPFFSENNFESLFVKNLENVQGDERDVIIFSICYGKDVNGRMSMNFGPLNKAGGERRLNVAVTRARREVLVFSSILPDEIDLSRTRAIGVKHLKSYLDFAMRGEQAIKETITDAHLWNYDSPFEKEVAVALRQKGFNVHTQIGCSGYRVDLAVVHPDFPGRYVLGIECDGAAYHSAKCARERDKLRQSVLESLGWKLHRIWSTDWWHNSEREIEKAVKKIEKALKEPVAPVTEVTPVELNQVVRSYEPVSEEHPANGVANPFERQYIEWSSTDILLPGDLFYSSTQNGIIRNLISEIVDFEGPITLLNLTRKVCTQFQLSRATQKAQSRIESLAAACNVSRANFKNQLSYWPKSLKVAEYREFRKNTENASRKAEDIPLQEVAVAAYSVLIDNVSIDVPDLVKAIANCFGFSRVGQNVESSIIDGIEYMLQHFQVSREGNKIFLINN